MTDAGLGQGSRGLAADRGTPGAHGPTGHAAGAGPGETRLALFLALALSALAFSPALALPLTGEDYVILNRDLAGETLSPHVFRPLSDGWLLLVHRVFGARSPLPFHLGSLGWHLVNVALWFAIARRLLRDAWSAAAVAGAMGLGLACLDAIAWAPAGSRLLSGAGAGVAILGLLDFAARPARGLAWMAGGLAFQLGADEDGYGTGLFLALALGGLALRGVHRRRALLGIAASAALILVHFAAARAATGRSPEEVIEVANALPTADLRMRQIVSGFGLPLAAAWPAPLAGAVLLFLARERRPALLGLGLWLTSFVPFCLSTPWPYRAYPSEGPVAFLLAGGLCALAGLLAAQGAGGAPARARWATRVAGLFVLGWCFLGPAAARGRAFASWSHGLEELERVLDDARRAAAEGGAEPPPLVNLERSALNAFAYVFRSDPRATRKIEFLDAPTGFEAPGQTFPGPWYGRRADGSYGPIEGAGYLAGRPLVQPLALYSRARSVASLAEARALLATGAVDVRHEVLIEAPAAALAGLDGSSGGAEAGIPPALEIAEPFHFQGTEGGIALRVRTDRPVVLAYLEHWLFESDRVMPAEDVYIHRRNDARSVTLTARDRASGETFPTFFANGLGLGALLPPGEHLLELTLTTRDYGRRLDTR